MKILFAMALVLLCSGASYALDGGGADAMPKDGMASAEGAGDFTPSDSEITKCDGGGGGW